MLKKYFQTDTRVVIALIVLVEIAFNLIVQKYALRQDILYNTLASDLTVEEIDKLSQTAHSYSWTNFVWAPLSILVQIFLVAVCINIGTLLLRYQIRFKEIFGIVARAFAVFAIARLLLIGAYFYFGVNDLSDLDYVSQLSLYAILDHQALPDWTVFPLQTVNLFQIAFILLLALGLNTLQHRGMKRWIPFVLGTYGTGLAIFVVLFIFLAFL